MRGAGHKGQRTQESKDADPTRAARSASRPRVKGPRPALGNRAAARLLRAATQEERDDEPQHAAAAQLSSQPELKINAPGDAQEQEADRIAGRAMSAPDTATMRGRAQKTRAAESIGGESEAVAPPIVHETLRSPGQPLEASTREFMETRFGHDFGQVRVHTDARAADSARSVEAEAYTVGQKIVFGHGRYDPAGAVGRRLLAHELAHVVQQRSAPYARPRLARKPPPTPKTKPQKPKPQKFTLLGTGFQAVTDPQTNVVTITPAGKSANGWTFTPAGKDTFTATRSPDKFEYVHASGSADQLMQKVTVTAAANSPVTVGSPQAVLGDPPKLSFELSSDGKRAAKKKSVSVFSASIESLELSTPPKGLVPADGDVIRLGLGGGAYVWSTLQTGPAPAQKPATPATPAQPTPQTPPATTTPTPPATTPPTTTPTTPPAAPTAQGFFDIGAFTRYKERGGVTYGFTSHSVSEARRAKFFDDLVTTKDPARKITAEEGTVFKTVSLIESDLAGVQTYDRGVLSFGFAQWTVHSDLPRMLRRVPAAVFEKYLGRYGLSVGAPVRALDSVAAKFIADGDKRMKLGVRSPGEGALFLNGKDVVTSKMLEAANKLIPRFDEYIRQATAAKADLASKDAKKVAAAKTALSTVFNGLKGLPGAKQNKDLNVMADALIKAAGDAKAVAKDLVDNSVSEEALRDPQWVLRFEMLGQDPGAQDAEIAQARATLSDTLALTVSGVPYKQLLRSKRARAALLSSYFNTPQGTQSGMRAAVAEYRTQKVAAAKKAAEDAVAAAAKAGKPAPTPTAPTAADWAAFPWPVSDAARWAYYTSAEVAAFEAIAILKMTAGTTDPARRRTILSAIPD